MPYGHACTARPVSPSRGRVSSATSVSVSLTIFFQDDILCYMGNVMTDSSICYSGLAMGLRVRGIIGGAGELRTAAPSAAKPFYYKRVSAEYFYRVSRGKQDKLPWPGTDPTGARLPESKQLELIAGVAAWQALSDSEKQAWRDLSATLRRWGGYQLFMSRYLTGQI